MTDDDDGDDWDLFGTNPHFLHRADSPVTSIIAAYSVDSKRLERSVLRVIDTFPKGVISDEVRDCFPKGTPYSSVTARYSSLDRNGLIFRDENIQRPGQSGRPQMIMWITELGKFVLSVGEPDVEDEF